MLFIKSIIRYFPIYIVPVFIVLLSGCKKEYKYVEKSRKEVGTLNLSPYEAIELIGDKGVEVTSLSIKAYSNISAEKKAKNLFAERREKAISTAEKIALGETEKKEIEPIPFSYKLIIEDKSGNEKIIDKTSDSFSDLRYHWWENEEDKKSNVYAGVRFGMSPFEVMKIEQFKDYEWNDLDQSYDGADYLGLYYYYIRLFFENGQLFKLEFTSPTYLNSNPFSEEFIDDIRNLRNIFWRVYGRPSHYGTIPSDYERFNYKSIYNWDTTKKRITVGCSESCSFATIIDHNWIEMNEDKERENKKNQELDKKAKEDYQEQLIENAVDKFR